MWASQYAGYDEKEYKDLIDKAASFTADDLVRIGKWKDGVTTELQWKPNVASVAYLIWMQAAQDLPKCPETERSRDILGRLVGQNLYRRI